MTFATSYRSEWALRFNGFIATTTTSLGLDSGVNMGQGLQGRTTHFQSFQEFPVVVFGSSWRSRSPNFDNDGTLMS